MVNREQQEKYLENGLTHFQLQSIADLLAVHGVNLHKIAGYSRLDEMNQQLFQGFIVNFFNAQGMDTRGTLNPKSIRYVSERGERYLRFDYARDDHDTWLHVTSSHTWY